MSCGEPDCLEGVTCPHAPGCDHACHGGCNPNRIEVSFPHAPVGDLVELTVRFAPEGPLEGDGWITQHPTLRRGDWVQTRSGRAFWPLDPRPDEVDLGDVCYALSHLCRFGGHAGPYSVAQHCMNVQRAVLRAGGTARQCLAALMHDWSEAYVVEVPKPLKNALEGYKAIEGRVQAAVALRFGVDPRDFDDELIHWADGAVLAAERRDLLGPAPRPWKPLPDPPEWLSVTPWAPELAELALRWSAQLYGLR